MSGKQKTRRGKKYYLDLYKKQFEFDVRQEMYRIRVSEEAWNRIEAEDLKKRCNALSESVKEDI